MAIINQPRATLWQLQAMEFYRHQRGLLNCDAGRTSSCGNSSTTTLSLCSSTTCSPSGGSKASIRTSWTSVINLISISSSTDAGKSRRSFSFFCGDEDVLHACAVSSNQLLFDSANWKHEATKRDLAGHRKVGAYQSASEQRDDGSCDGDAC